jgi:hypothetical protein
MGQDVRTIIKLFCRNFIPRARATSHLRLTAQEELSQGFAANPKRAELSGGAWEDEFLFDQQSLFICKDSPRLHHSYQDIRLTE